MMLFPTCLFLIVASVQFANVSADELVDVEVTGREKSPTEQCRERLPARPAGVCKTEDPATWCAQLVCTEPGRTDIPVPIETGPALDGTWCGDNKICLQGSCVDDTQPPENPKGITGFQYDCEYW